MTLTPTCPIDTAWPQRLTVPVVETLIADLKDCVKEAKASPGGQGSMVVLYGPYFLISLDLLSFSFRLSADLVELLRFFSFLRAGGRF
jgi:hypothetical protein